VKPHTLALLVVLLVTNACAHADADPADQTSDGSRTTRVPVETRRTADALALLHAWDRRRSHAWTRSDPAALADLYSRGSRTGRHDRAMLAAYAARGLRVTGLRTQLLGGRLRSWTPRRVTLEVVDRVVGAHAVGGGVRITLPRDRPSTRVISLRRVAGAWCVGEVRPVPQTARP
jgi:hypothetical protein